MQLVAGVARRGTRNNRQHSPSNNSAWESRRDKTDPVLVGDARARNHVVYARDNVSGARIARSDAAARWHIKEDRNTHMRKKERLKRQRRGGDDALNRATRSLRRVVS